MHKVLFCSSFVHDYMSYIKLENNDNNIIGFILFFFARSSWLYTLALVFQLFSLLIFKRYYIDDRTICFIIWPINILLQLLPLSSRVNFGPQQMYKNQKYSFSRCLLTPGNNFSAYKLWLNLVFRDVVLAVFLCIAVLTLIILIYKYQFVEKSDPMNKTINMITLYPYAMFISWIPSIFYGMYRDEFYDENGYYPFHSLVIGNYFEACVAIYGVLVAMIFYTKTKQARKEWLTIYYKLFNIVSDDNFRSSRSSVSSDASESEEKAVTDKVVSDVINPYIDTSEVLKASQQI